MKIVLALLSIASLGLGIVACVVAARAARSGPRGAEAGLPRAALASTRVAAVSLVSFPVLWLAMGAEVAEWPGMICAAGVLRLGTDAGGLAAGLPYALGAAIVAKGLALGATGVWILLRRIESAAPQAALARRATLWMAAAGALVAIDGAASLAWVALPRDTPRVYSGCCTSEVISAAAPPPVSSDGVRIAWTVAFLGSGVGAAGVLGAGAARPALRRGVAWWPVAGAAAVVTTATGLGFATAALAPARLRLPLHECGFCLLARAPENWLGAAALAAVAACTAWAWIASRATSGGDVADRHAKGLLGAASLAAAAAVVLGAAGRWLA